MDIKIKTETSVRVIMSDSDERLVVDEFNALLDKAYPNWRNEDLTVNYKHVMDFINFFLGRV